MDESTERRAATNDGTSTTGMPRWVKVSLIVVGLLIALVLILKLTGAGGEHGPGRHMGAGLVTDRVSSVSERAV